MNSKSGFSLIEVLISTAILLVIVVMVSMVFQQQSAAFQTGEDRVQSQATLRNIMGMISRDLSQAIDPSEYPALADISDSDGKSKFGSTEIQFFATSGNATEGTLVQNIKYTFSGSAVTRTCVDWEVGDNGKWKRGNKAESRLNHPTTSPLDSFKFDIDGNADYPERVAIQASIRNTSHASAVSGQCAGPDKRFGTRDDIYVGEKRQ